MTAKTAISLDEELLKKVDALAGELHLSRSGVFAEAVHEYLMRHENHLLFEAINDTYGKEQDGEERQLRRRRQRGHRRLVEGEW